jgi:hypothetical protein
MSALAPQAPCPHCPPGGPMGLGGGYDASRKGHAHGVPQLPFEIDGQRARPPDLVLLRDRPVHTVATVNDDGEPEPPVRIFTTEDMATQALQETA